MTDHSLVLVILVLIPLVGSGIVFSLKEAQAQLALMYEEPARVSVSWFCQMFLIFAVGVQFDDIYDTDGATYHEIGQKYIDDAIDENPQSTIWVIRAMLLLCIYQPPTKWNSVWMHLGNAISRRKILGATVAYNLQMPPFEEPKDFS